MSGLEGPPEEAVAEYELRLYIAGHTAKSAKAIANLHAVCEEHLNGRYRVQILDVLERPELARNADIVALPTLLRTLPEPIRRMVGDLSDTEMVLVGLEIRPRDTPT